MKILIATSTLILACFFSLMAQKVDFPIIHELKFRSGASDYVIVLDEDEEGNLLVLSELLDEYWVERRKLIYDKMWRSQDLTYSLTTKHSTSFVGHWLGKSDDNMVFYADSQVVYIAKQDIRNIEFYKPYTPRSATKRIKLKSGAIAPPFNTSYFFMPAAYTLPRNELLYTNLLFAINGFTYGITDQWQITGGFEIISPITTSTQNNGEAVFPNSLLLSAYRLRFSDKMNLKLGGFYIYNNSLEVMGTERHYYGGFGVFTYGSPYTNISFGAAYAHNLHPVVEPYIGGKFAFGNSKRLSFVAETFSVFTRDWGGGLWLNGDILVLMMGVQYSKNRFSTTIGVAPSSPILYIDFLYKFQLKKPKFGSIKSIFD